jgi:hypothetical protein
MVAFFSILNTLNFDKNVSNLKQGKFIAQIQQVKG